MGKRPFQNGEVSPSLSKLLRHPILSAEEELKLARRVRRGDKRAVDLLISRNLRSVMKIAQGFRGYGIDIEDLFQIGVIGLQKAILKFDPKLGNRLGTYAAWWIRQSISRYCRENSKTIRLPNNVWNRLYALKKKQRAAEADPDDRTLAAELADDPDLEWLRQVLSQEPVSLDEAQDNSSGSGGDGASLYEVIADEATSAPPEQRLEDGQRVDLVRRALQQLTPREQQVLDRRFGADHTLAEIAEDHGLSRERVRQIETKALKKLAKAVQKMTAEDED